MLALIAGTGRLPQQVVGALGERPLVCALEGFLPEGLEVDRRFRIEHLGSFVAELTSQGVDEICLAGAIRRVPVEPGLIDAATMPLVPILQQALAGGDDAALRAVMGIFERAGMTVRAAHEIAPDLLPPAGVPTRAAPGVAERSDATRAEAVVAAMGQVDIGQSCAVRGGQVLAVEGGFGTDWMLESLRQRPDGTGGILFKAPKPGQDRRADLPAIGPETIRGAAAAGLNGVVIEAQGVMVLDRAEVIAECDRLDLFLWVRGAGE